MVIVLRVIIMRGATDGRSDESAANGYRGDNKLGEARRTPKEERERVLGFEDVQQLVDSWLHGAATD
jgi:hypothetical protein